MMVMMMVMTMMTMLLSCYDRAVRRQNLLDDNSTTLSSNLCLEVKRTNKLGNELEVEICFRNSSTIARCFDEWPDAQRLGRVTLSGGALHDVPLAPVAVFI